MKRKLCDICRTGHNGQGCREPYCACELCHREAKTKEEARDYAIGWQAWVAEQNLSYGELAEWQEFFTRLADKFDLIEEFKENEII